MPERERVNLTDRAVARLRPRAREYTVWDRRLVGLGVRVRPTGGQSYVLLQNAAGRSRRVSLGPVTTMGIAEARRECHARMTDPEAAGAVPARAVPLFRDFVAGEWKEARFERCKPSTKKGVISVLEGQLLPAFGLEAARPHHPCSDQAMVRRLQPNRARQRQSRARPSPPDHELRHRLRPCRHQPGARGETEPAPDPHPLPVPRGGRPPSPGPRRADTEGETRAGRYHPAPALHRMPQGRGSGAPLVRGSIATRSCWPTQRPVRERSPSTARPAPSSTARPRNGSPFVFPSPRNSNRPRSRNLALWDRVRREAGIEDVRLHDLRHTVASHAAMNGVPLPVVSRLLGHSDPRTTLRYAHLGDREIEAAAERVGKSIAAIMDSGIAEDRNRRRQEARRVPTAPPSSAPT